MGGTAVLTSATAGVRSGMVDIVSRLRRLVADMGTVYWTDVQLQDWLDKRSLRLHREPLLMEKRSLNGTAYEYRVYHSKYGDLEGGGTEYFLVEDSAGVRRGTEDYSVDYIRGVVTMMTDQAGTHLYLTATSYDLNGAAADVWLAMAGSVSDRYSISADGHELSRSEWFDHCVRMSNLFSRQARPRYVSQVVEGDFFQERL